MGISLQPVTEQQAKDNRAKAYQRGKFPFMVNAVSVLVGLVALAYIADDMGTDVAVLFLLGAVVIGTASSLYLGTVMKAAQYRIKRPGWQLIGVLAFVAGLVVIWALGEATMALGLTWGRTLFVVIVVAVLGVAWVFYARAVLLFEGSCLGVLFPRYLAKWPNVSQVVYTDGSKPGTVEIGVRLVPNAVEPSEPRPVRAGQLLTDLPARGVVPERLFDLERLRWVLNQSGRRDVALIERTPGGERLVGYSNNW